MELGKADEIVEAQLAAATRAQVALGRERLRKLWMGLNHTESVIRRGQVAYLTSTELLSRGERWIALRK
jgi:hypothetical protein